MNELHVLAGVMFSISLALAGGCVVIIKTNGKNQKNNSHLLRSTRQTAALEQQIVKTQPLNRWEM